MAKTLITVNGTYRNVKDGFITVDGEYRRIKDAYITVNGVYRPIWSSYDPVFANNTWEQIAEACHTRRVPDTWSVGDQKTMTIDGTDYLIDIIGKDHDDYSDGSGKAPLTFQMHDCYTSIYCMNNNGNNVGGWENSTMRSISIPQIITLLPNEVQKNLKAVIKFTSNGYGDTTVGSTNDTLFLLSEYEVFGRKNNSYGVEGNQYSYYINGGSKIKYSGSGVCVWSLRSPSVNNSTQFCCVNAVGSIVNSQANNKRHISFAFCF